MGTDDLENDSPRAGEQEGLEAGGEGGGPAIAFGEMLANCQAAEELANPTQTADQTDALAFTEEPYTHGDDVRLDRLWDACEAGSGAACDELWARAPIDSEYEHFGVTCGNRLEVLDCTREMDSRDPQVSEDSTSPTSG